VNPLLHFDVGDRVKVATPGYENRFFRGLEGEVASHPEPHRGLYDVVLEEECIPDEDDATPGVTYFTEQLCGFEMEKVDD